MKNNEDEKVQNLPIYMCIGISVGTGIGAAVSNIPVCMSIGLCIGVAIGALLDWKNRKKDAEPPETDTAE